MGLFEQMTPGEARLSVLAAGAVLIALVYVWGNRVRLRAGLEERRRRRAQRAADLPVLDEAAGADAGSAAPAGGYSDPFAHQRLVDVEIVPVRRTGGAEATPPEQPEPAAASAPPAAEAPSPVPAAAPPAEAVPAPVLTPAAAPLAAPAAPRARPVVPPAPKLDAEVGMTWAGPGARSESPARGPEPGIPPLNLRPAANALRTESGAPIVRGTETMAIVLTVMADPDARFTGMELLMAAHDLGLKFSKQGLFDGYVNGEVRGKPVFSIANVVEPGVFPPDDVQRLSTPGLLLFMRLPGSVDPLPALELLLSQSRRLAARLGGTLCDEQRRRLGPDGISELRVRVTDYQRRLRQMAPA